MIDRGALIGTVRAVRIAGPGREFLIDDEPVDVHIVDGRIADIAPTGALAAHGEVLEADGRGLSRGSGTTMSTRCSGR
ncbi:hypothetical protein [Microbacterium sp. Se63.02b]|uniref:hypothetical protein n=1 Tax=Microbacterium sp. Se63.02b TaxID=2709304 RepID=UPI0031F71D77